MKKKFITVIAIVILSVTTFAGGVYANEAYNQWKGTDSYNSLMVTLEDIGVKSKKTKEELSTANQTNTQLTNELANANKNVTDLNGQLQIERAEKEGFKSQLETANQSIASLENVVKNKENIIKNRDNQLEAKQKEIDTLNNSDKSNKDQLKQAEKDMKEAEKKAKDVLNGLN